MDSKSNEDTGNGGKGGSKCKGNEEKCGGARARKVRAVGERTMMTGAIMARSIGTGGCKKGQ